MSTAVEEEMDDGPYHSYCLIDLVVNAHSMEYSYRRNNVRFYVVIREEDLIGPQRIIDDFLAFKTDIGDPDVLFEFEQWVLFCLEGVMRTRAPTEDVASRLTLLEYYAAPAYAFHLANVGGRLCPVEEAYDPAIHGDASPRTTIADSLSDSDSDDDICATVSAGTSTILRSSLPPVTHFLASQLERVPDGLRSHEMSDPPRRVRLCSPLPHPAVPSSVSFFFKAGVADHGHLREVALLGRIAASVEFFDDPFRTSRLAGLVVWDDDVDSLMGLLMEYIPGRTLGAALAAGTATLAERRKWFAQVEATVARLHAADIIWGDVKPDNVMINEGGDAVLVDFGGGYTPRYIPRSMHETVEGDLMGLQHIKAEMHLA